MHALPHLMAFACPALAVVGYALGGWWTFLATVYPCVVLPALDFAVPPRRLARRSHMPKFAYSLILWASAPVQAALVLWCLWIVAYAAPTAIESVGLALAAGFSASSLGYAAAHELVHRRGLFERAWGLVLLALASNMQFRISHVYIHHRDVGRSRDPATARRGENVYAFALRSILGQHVASFWEEARRLTRRGYRGWRRLLRNRIAHYAVIQTVLLASVYAWFGWRGLAFFVAQGVVAIFVLEVHNYIAHYGLVRRKNAHGRCQPISPHHSWNSSHAFSNWTFFNLGLHSSHHVKGSIDYPALNAMKDVPQLPTGSPGSAMLALVPPLWRRIMEPRLERWTASEPSS